MPELTTRYSRATIVIHWLTAAGVVLAIALGWRMAHGGGTNREAVLAWHMSAGLAILLLTLARLATRARSRRPPPVGTAREQRAASLGHAALYVLLLVLPLLGWLAISVASGASRPVFGFIPWPALPGVSGQAALGGFAEFAHRWLAYGLGLAVVGHVVAAIRHQMHDPANGLARMLPGASRLRSWRLAVVTAVLILCVSYGSGIADGWLPRAWTLAGQPAAERFASIDPRRAHVFATVQPIFEEKCASCHGADTQKGGLKLDTFAGAMRGGESGKVIVPGKVDESELVQRILLPPSHKNAMPPVGKAALTPAESQLMMWWISAGADDSTTIVAANPPPLVQLILQTLGISADSPVFKKPVVFPEAKTLARLRDSFEIQFLFRGQGFLQAQPRFDRQNAGSLPIEELRSVADQLVRLDLSGSKATGPQFASLAGLQHLQRLNLAHTGVDDGVVLALQDLPYLEVLNLYGTKVSDAGLAAVEHMPSLMTIYLSDTSITEAAVERLRKAQPGLKVIWAPPEAE